MNGFNAHSQIHNDMAITITVHDGSGVRAVLNRTRRFHRVPLPPAGSSVQPVQVDHARQGLLVVGTRARPFLAKTCSPW